MLRDNYQCCYRKLQKLPIKILPIYKYIQELIFLLFKPLDNSKQDTIFNIQLSLISFTKYTFGLSNVVLWKKLFTKN